MKRLVFVVLLALTGCAHVPEPKVVTVIAKVPVAVSCVSKELPGPQTYIDTMEALRAAKGADERYRLMSSEWGRRDARLTAVEAALANCR